VAVVSALALVAAGIASAHLLRDQVPRIQQRRSRLASVTESAAPGVLAPEYRVELVTLRGVSGLDVQLAVKRPRAADGTPEMRRPVALLLGGHRTGRDAVHLIDDTRGVVVAALSYPFSGNHRVKGLAIVSEVPAIRQGILDTPPAVMLALDYLLAQPYADPAQVEAVGVSLGAPFVTIAAALDERIGRVWVVHGTGGAYTPIEFNLRRQLGSRLASVPLAALGAMLISGPRLAPERWVADIAPRPVVMINALDDERLPRASIERLFDSAREPKEMIWVSGGHVRSEAEAVKPLVKMVLERMLSDPLSLPIRQ
jgi:hypothetical protein